MAAGEDRCTQRKWIFWRVSWEQHPWSNVELLGGSMWQYWLALFCFWCFVSFLNTFFFSMEVATYLLRIFIYTRWNHTQSLVDLNEISKSVYWNMMHIYSVLPCGCSPTWSFCKLLRHEQIYLLYSYAVMQCDCCVPLLSEGKKSLVTLKNLFLPGRYIC